MALKDRFSQVTNKIKENLTTSSESVPPFLGSSTAHYASEPDIFGETIKTPHGEMKASRKIYRNLPQVNASIELFTDMVMGRNLTIETEDPEAEYYFNNYILPKLKPALREAVENYCITGNGYIEILRNPSSGKPVNFVPIPESEKMYIDYNQNFQPTKYILKNKLRKGEGVTVRYYPNKTSKKHIKGDVFDTDDIIHLKNGVSKIPVYGRSDIASAYDDYQIYDELQRDLAVISRWKSIAKHILTIKNIDDSPLTKEEKEDFDKAIKESDDNENIITNKAVEKTDLGYNGKHEDIQKHIKEINKRITSTIIPSFYMHGDVTNYAVAEDQKSGLYLRIQSKRDSFIDKINKVLREIASFEGYTDSEPELNFGEFDFPTKKEKIKNIATAWKNGGCRLQDYQKVLGIEPDPDFGDAYKWELTQEQQQEVELPDDIEQALKKTEG